MVEQPLEHLDHPEDLSALVLVDVVELGRGMELARHHAVVESGGYADTSYLLKATGTRAAEAQEIEEAVAPATSRLQNLLHQLGETIFELLFVLTTLFERQSRPADRD